MQAAMIVKLEWLHQYQTKQTSRQGILPEIKRTFYSFGNDNSLRKHNITVYTSNNKALKYTKQKQTKPKGKTDTDFNSIFLVIDKANKQKLRKAVRSSETTINQLELIDIYGTLVNDCRIHHSSKDHTDCSPKWNGAGL